MNITDKQLFILLGVAAFAVWFAAKQAAKVGEAVNPLNDENIFYTGTNAVGAVLADDQDWTLGGAIYDWTH